MFEIATRLKLRFESPKGLLTTEDLWDLPLTSQTGKPNLDDIAKGIHKQLKSNNDFSFVTPKETDNSLIQLQMDIVTHIINVRISERNSAALEAERKAKKQRILAAIAQKQDDALYGASLEELQKMAEDL